MTPAEEPNVLDEIDMTQVISHLPNGKIRIYNITSLHFATDDDPLTTIEVDGYQDVEGWVPYAKEAHDNPLRTPESDGVYPRCVWCNGENYGPAVIDYSLGKCPCASVNACGKYLPEGYIKLTDPSSGAPKSAHPTKSNSGEVKS